MGCRFRVDERRIILFVSGFYLESWVYPGMCVWEGVGKRRVKVIFAVYSIFLEAKVC